MTALDRITNDTWLTIYDNAHHTLYVYPSALSSSHTNCSYSLHIDGPGGAVDRRNCGIGSEGSAA